MDNDGQSLNEQLYDQLEKSELMLQGALVDPRYGKDADYTQQTKSLESFTVNLRSRLRDSANQIFIQNSKELKAFLEDLGIHSDHMHDLKEEGQIAATIGSAVEKVVKIAHPLL